MIGENITLINKVFSRHNVCYTVFVKPIDPVLLLTLSDLFVNLSAGWFGAVYFLLVDPKKPASKKFLVLTLNIVFAMVSLIISFALKKLVGL